MAVPSQIPALIERVLKDQKSCNISMKLFLFWLFNICGKFIMRKWLNDLGSTLVYPQTIKTLMFGYDSILLTESINDCKLIKNA